jgi:hypothetical protein
MGFIQGLIIEAAHLVASARANTGDTLGLAKHWRYLLRGGSFAVVAHPIDQ